MARYEHAFLKLKETIETLRGADGCTWDIEQTSKSLRPYFVEEFYEVLDAIDEGDKNSLKEELGDLLVHIFFQADIATKNKDFSITSVAEDVTKKLQRRHPHIFGTAKRPKNSAELERDWEKTKRKEARQEGKQEGKQKSVLKQLPNSLPAMGVATTYLKRLSRSGFLLKGDGIRTDFKDEVGAGDALLQLISVIQKRNIDPEVALKRSCERLKESVVSRETKG